MAVGGDQGHALDRRQLRRQVAVDVEQEALHVQLGQQRAHRALLDDAAVVDDRQVPAQALGFFQVVRGQDDGGAGDIDLAQDSPHIAADFDVHARGGLVEDQQARAGHHRAGDHQPPFHAAGQRAAHHLRLLPQVRALELDLGQRLGFLARHAVEAGVVDQDVERLLEQVEIDFLRHQADQAHRRAALAHQVGAEHFDLAFAEVDQGGNDADQGGLAGAIGAEQGEEIAWLHFQRDALEGLHAVVVGLAQIPHAQRGSRGTGIGIQSSCLRARVPAQGKYCRYYRSSPRAWPRLQTVPFRSVPGPIPAQARRPPHDRAHGRPLPFRPR